MMRFADRGPASAVDGLAATALALAIPLGVVALGLLAAGLTVQQALSLMLDATFGNRTALVATLHIGTILIMTGLATSLALRVGMLNFGAQGQLVAGALGVDLVVWLLPGRSPAATLPVVLAAAALAGTAAALPSIIAYRRRRGDEAIVSLLMNFVMQLFASTIFTASPVQPAAATDVARMPLPAIHLSSFDGFGAISPGLVIALALTAVIAAALPLTAWGFKLRVTGGNPDAARFAGMKVGSIAVTVGLISGALAGLAAAAAAIDGSGSLDAGIVGGLGYVGIVVAVLSGRSTLAVAFNGLALAAVLGIAAAMRQRGLLPFGGEAVLPAAILSIWVVVDAFARTRSSRQSKRRIPA